MNNESQKALDSSHDQRMYRLLSTNNEHTVYSDEESTSDEVDGAWFPGDGVCPPTSQFNQVYRTAYDAWTSAASRFTQTSGFDLFRVDSFLGLLQNVPHFLRDPPQNIDLRERSNSPLMLRSSLRLGTTEDSSCDRRWKTIEYFQCLGFPKPMTYRETVTFSPATPGLEPSRPGYLTSVILAWSYILSSRWVEILQLAGLKSSVTHDHGEQLTTNFWVLITQNRWSTQVENDTGTFYAPWMLRKANCEEVKR